MGKALAPALAEAQLTAEIIYEGSCLDCGTPMELLTEGDTLEEALVHVQDAFAAVVEMYEDMGKSLPAAVQPAPTTIHLDYAVAVP